MDVQLYLFINGTWQEYNPKPAAHSHTISEVTGLQSQLNSKLNLSGGTMTGSITMGSNNITGNNSSIFQAGRIIATNSTTSAHGITSKGTRANMLYLMDGATGGLAASLLDVDVKNTTTPQKRIAKIGIFGSAISGTGGTPSANYLWLSAVEDNTYNKDATLKVDAQNRVGIAIAGSERPTQALDVDGKIRMRTATVDADSSDIVVTKGYMLSKIVSDTNNYLTNISGSGNGTVTFTRQGLSPLTWNATHNHTWSEITGKSDNNEVIITGQNSFIDLGKKTNWFWTRFSGENWTFNNTYTGGGWARNLMEMKDAEGTAYFRIGAQGSSQSFTQMYIGPAYNNYWLSLNGTRALFNTKPQYASDPTANNDLTRKEYVDNQINSHTHTIANITNLQTTLNGKANSSHTHTIANITNLQTTLDKKLEPQNASTVSNDCNNITTTSIYQGSWTSNTPPSVSYGTLITTQTTHGSSLYLRQIYLSENSTKMYTRVKASGNWGVWQQIGTMSLSGTTLNITL